MNNPDEILTVAHCSKCKSTGLAGTLVDTDQHELQCAKCTARLSERDIYSYADLQVADYHGGGDE